MSAASEPEKYSVDEMLERLKYRPTEEAIEDGELVTRADGSQAIKVRKRKRRTQQPHKEERKQHQRIRMIQVAVILALILAAVVGAGTAIVYANSAPYREQLLRNLALSSGARATIEQFRMSPTCANAEQVSLTWPAGNALASVTLRKVRANISPISFLGHALTGDDVASADATVNLRLPVSGQPLRETPAPGDNPPVRFESYATSYALLLLGDAAAPLMRLQNSECTFYPVGSNGHAQLLLNRGDILISGWPKLRMDRSHIEFRGTDIDVVAMRLLHESDNRGVFELAGSLSPYAAGHASPLAVRLDAYPLAGITGPQLAGLLTGRIDSATNPKGNLLTITPGENPEVSLALAFHNTPTSSFELSGFPFLLGLSHALHDPWFERPLFAGEVTGVLRREHGKVILSDLNMETKGRMAIRGELTLNADLVLSGHLVVGLAEAMIKASKVATLDSLFEPSKDGFRWLTLQVGGSASAPTDDFRQRFENTLRSRPSPPAGATPTFEELTTPPASGPNR